MVVCVHTHTHILEIVAIHSVATFSDIECYVHIWQKEVILEGNIMHTYNMLPKSPAHYDLGQS